MWLKKASEEHFVSQGRIKAGLYFKKSSFNIIMLAGEADFSFFFAEIVILIKVLAVDYLCCISLEMILDQGSLFFAFQRRGLVYIWEVLPT